ncbi:phytanoyl-CoA dioxygenase family protein [Streptomyces europaeiscabiei]|uniref:phytanoyl-CoA dioxygenase family protein n=1 Tax=Streptomyces europaeiscabiei TaxID=146819 RepID=UPI002E12851B|nr:phytanoyl-CoA dioxygenase family protein [Streptomyces europaeiscabiei]
MTQVRDAGYTVLEGALAADDVEAMRRQYMSLFGRLRDSGENGRIQTSHSGTGHYQMQPRFSGILGDPKAFAHPLALDSMRAILGDELRIAYYTSNFSEPGSGHQQVHRDTKLLFGAETDVPTPPFMLVLNVLLHDFTTENGGTEMWPGTHLLSDKNFEQYPHNLDSRVKALPSLRVNAPAGSIIIRDVRMWHRGMPNVSAEPRAMLSVVYKRKWYQMRYDASLEAPIDTFKSWPSGIQDLFIA